MKDDTTLAEHQPRTGSVSYYAQVFTPPTLRSVTGALYALNRALDAARDGQDPGVARLKLQWWREELQRLAEGQPRHPITQALRDCGVTPDWQIDTLAAGRENELAHQTTNTSGEWETQISLVTGRNLELWSRLLGAPVDLDLRAARALSQGLHLCAALRRCHGAARHGHLTLPAEWLQRSDITIQQLWNAEADSATQQLLDEVAARAVVQLDEALQQWPPEQRSAHVPLLITAELRRHILTLQREEGFRNLDQRFTTTPIRKLWRAWRISRRYRKAR